MASTHQRRRRMVRVGVSLALAAGLVGGPWSAVPPAAAAGNFVVNSLLDTNAADANLTLREALLVANGSLTIGLSLQEQAQLGGCIFTANNITGGCGAGLADTITFADALGYQPVITLGAALPALIDGAGTVLDGVTNGVLPIINAAGAGASQNGLNLLSNQNSVYGLAVVGSPLNGIYISGDYTYIGSQTSVRASGSSGVLIENGSHTLIEDSAFGVYGSLDSACGVGNATHGIAIAGDAQYNTLARNTIGCNGEMGVWVAGTSADHNVIGPGNAIGANLLATTDLSNTTGIYVGAGAQFNAVLTNTIGFNQGNGVQLQGADTAFNAVRANLIVSQGAYGVYLDEGARDNQIGSPLGGPLSGGNTISLNHASGLYLSGAATRDNSVFGNKIGTDATGTLDWGNSDSGVFIGAGAHGNAIGQQATERNLISGNGQAGVLLDGGAYNNYVQGNYLGTNISGTAALPNTTGVTIRTGAHSNWVGSPLGLAYLNLIAGNSSHGVLISGGATTSNTVAYNDLGVNSTGLSAANSVQSPSARTVGLGEGSGAPLPNGGSGLALLAEAHHNRLGPGNWAGYNLGHGLYVADGSNLNWIAGGSLFHNQGYGALFDASSGNVISQTSVFANGRDGLGERNGAQLNWWTRLEMHDNAGLGIDKLAASDLTNTVTGPTPVITSTQVNGVINVTVRGTATLVPSAASVVELYLTAGDPSGHGEGRQYLGTAVVTLDGTWSLTIGLKLAGNGCYTALQIDSSLVKVPLAQASEFSRNWGNCQAYLPLIMR